MSTRLLIYFAAVRAPTLLSLSEASEILNVGVRDRRSHHWPGPIGHTYWVKWTKRTSERWLKSTQNKPGLSQRDKPNNLTSMSLCVRGMWMNQATRRRSP